MGRLVNTPTYNFNIDIQQSTNYALPAQILTSTPSPIYARIKNTGAGTITIEEYQIIFFMGQPAQGSPITLTTIAPNQTKYFIVDTRYLPSSYVSWDNTSLVVDQGKVSIKKQNLGIGKLNLKSKYLYKATGAGLTPNINGLRFYDTGETFYTNKVFYDETNTYMMWISPAGYWFIKALPLNPYTPGPSFAKAFSNSGEPPTGNYVGGNGYIGTVTISPI